MTLQGSCGEDGLGMMKLPPLKEAPGTGLLFHGCPRHMWKTFFKSASVSKAILEKEEREALPATCQMGAQTKQHLDSPKISFAPFGLHAFGIVSLW